MVFRARAKREPGLDQAPDLLLILADRFWEIPEGSLISLSVGHHMFSSTS